MCLLCALGTWWACGGQRINCGAGVFFITLCGFWGLSQVTRLAQKQFYHSVKFFLDSWNDAYKLWLSNPYVVQYLQLCVTIPQAWGGHQLNTPILSHSSCLGLCTKSSTGMMQGFNYRGKVSPHSSAHFPLGRSTTVIEKMFSLMLNKSREESSLLWPAVTTLTP